MWDFSKAIFTCNTILYFTWLNDINNWLNDWLQAVEYYNSTVLGAGGVQSNGGPIQPDSAYKSLGSVYGQDSSPPRDKTKKLSLGAGMTYSGVKSARSVQNMAERSYSVSEVSRGHMGQQRTPHRAAGYGGAGQPTRGPHRWCNKTISFEIIYLISSSNLMIWFLPNKISLLNVDYMTIMYLISLW